MPIYEYACGACGARKEIIQGIRDEPLTVCDQCHQPALQKLISASVFRLKGGGWYETDFKKDNQKNLVESGDNSAVPAKNSEGGDGSSTDTSTPSSSSSPESIE